MSEDRATTSDTRERFLAVTRRIHQAAEHAGRDPSSVRLVAVSKTRPVASVLELARLGQVVFGENRIQESAGKIPGFREQWSGDPVTWRLIGHLQRNKVRAALDLFDTIDSLDSFRLWEAIGNEAERRGRRVPVLLQFNCSDEAAKSGFAPDEVTEVAGRIDKVAGIEVQGIMTMGPLAEDPEAARPAFRKLFAIRERLRELTGKELPELSMGMSGDMEVGIEEGATLVRVGTSLFGTRE